MNLDIGCGHKTREGFTGMDKIGGVDIVHDIESIPWPIKDNSCYAINASHVLEHIKPWMIFDVMNEAWRCCKKDGGIDIRVPIGLSYSLDPSHTILFNAASFWYFTPTKDLYNTYKPNPWSIVHNEVDNKKLEIRVILQKIDKEVL